LFVFMPFRWAFIGSSIVFSNAWLHGYGVSSSAFARAWLFPTFLYLY